MKCEPRALIANRGAQNRRVAFHFGSVLGKRRNFAAAQSENLTKHRKRRRIFRSANEASKFFAVFKAQALREIAKFAACRVKFKDKMIQVQKQNLARALRLPCKRLWQEGLLLYGAACVQPDEKIIQRAALFVTAAFIDEIFALKARKRQRVRVSAADVDVQTRFARFCARVSQDVALLQALPLFFRAGLCASSALANSFCVCLVLPFLMLSLIKILPSTRKFNRSPPLKLIKFFIFAPAD